jgi:subtilisin family serine protease
MLSREKETVSSHRAPGWRIVSSLPLAVALLAADHAWARLLDADRARMMESRRVGGDVVEALDAAPSTRVIVAFNAPGAPDAGSRSADDRALRRQAIAAKRARLLGGMSTGDFILRRAFEHIEAMAGEITPAGLLRLIRDPDVVHVDLDHGGSAQLAQAVPLTNIDQIQALGFTGAGVTVAVIDSGIDTDHPDLGDSLVDEQCFCSGGSGCCPGGGTTQSGPGSAEDNNGHGTNVTGIITSNGTIAPVGGAPDADVIAVKVLDSAASFCCSSDVIAGMDWVLTNHPETRVVNMSLGTFALFAGDCDNFNATTIAYASAVNALTANGTIVFASSGNQGSGTSMSAPACVASAMSVGAVWDSNVGSVTVLSCTETSTAADQVTCFTNSNASTDLFAPGAPTTSTGLGGGTSTYFGTSQASPLAAACAAALLEADSSLTPSQLETALESSPVMVTDVTNGLSFPRLDCLAALDAVDTGPCPIVPLAGCRTATQSLLLLKDLADPSDSLLYKWLKGQSTTQADFADPTAGSDYSICIYTGPGNALALQATVSAGSSGWQPIGSSGYKYLDAAGVSDGIRKVLLKGSSNEKAKIIVKGKGINLPDPMLDSFTPPVTVQVHKSDAPSPCWESTFSAGHIIKNEPDRFKAKRTS